MVNIPLVAEPNQSLEISIDDSNYKIELKAIDDNPESDNLFMAISITKDDEQLVLNTRAITGSPLIPYPHLLEGNFFFSTVNETYPNYSRFETDQTLFYASAEEIEVASG